MEYMLGFLISGLIVVGVLIALTREVWRNERSTREVLGYVVAALWGMAFTGFFGLAIIGQHTAHIDTNFSRVDNNTRILNEKVTKLNDFQEGSNTSVSLLYEDVLSRLEKVGEGKSGVKQ